MTTLSHDRITAYDMVSDTLGKAVITAVAIINQEREKEQPDQAVIDKFKSVLNELSTIRFNLTDHIDNLPELERIDAHWAKFIKKYW